jgi:hypothetical protein
MKWTQIEFFAGRVFRGFYKGKIVAVKRYRSSKSFIKSEVRILLYVHT